MQSPAERLPTDPPPPPPPAGTLAARTRVLLVAGPVGAGKTTLINTLLRQKPSAERWAVLVNDFGHSEHEGAETEGVVVQHLLGSCACCSGSGVVLRTALVQLLRRSRPSRVIVELSTLGQPAQVALILERDFRQVLALGCIATIVPIPSHEELFSGSEFYRAQVEQATLLLLVGSTDSKAQAAIRAELSEMSTSLLTVDLSFPSKAGDGADLCGCLPVEALLA